MGHASAVFLLRPELLSVFSAAYVFADRYFGQPARARASARRELRATRAGAISWHLTNFLYPEGSRNRRLNMCSAEQARPGFKFGDISY